MRRASFLFAGLAALALVLTPAVADARAGSSSSSGSRGSRTNSAPPSTSTAPGTAQPMQRTMTPAPAPTTAGAPAGVASGATAAAPSRWGGSFGAGLMGGIIGAGIGGMLFGHGFTGGLGGMAGFLGFLMQMALIGGIIYLVVRLVRGRRPAMAGGPAMFEAPHSGPVPGPMGGGRPSGPSVQIAAADFASFEKILKDVQAAWTAQNMAALQSLATPEMVSYFADDLAEQTSRGVRNTVTEVRLLKGDLAEAWSEGNKEYATVAMRFGMIDVTRNAAGHVVEGSATEPTTATELWTFLRTSGGRWILSAIQQTR